MGERKLIYERGRWRISAWVERYAEGMITAYVEVTRDHRHIRTEWARTTPARWWAPWERRRELATVVTEALQFIDEQESLETSAEATLEAVTEAMRLT